MVRIDDVNWYELGLSKRTGWTGPTDKTDRTETDRTGPTTFGPVLGLSFLANLVFGPVGPVRSGLDRPKTQKNLPNWTGPIEDRLITGLTWCINNGMQVVNMSLGLSQDMKSFHTALTQAYNAGIVLVAAAGNTSGPTIYPAAYPQCISVSATDQKSNALAYFSSYGKVDLAAPGVNIKSCWLNGGYVVESGTSMSTAHVTGVVALHLMKYPGLTPAQVLADLQAEATPLGSPADFGAGEVNAYKAAQ